jgi:phage terminase large subunit GpA-like protein
MSLIPNTIKPLPPFAHLAGRRVTARPPRALRRRLRTPEKLSISQWAERYRRVTEIDAKPGRWRNEMVPHAVPIMDSISHPWVRQVWICLPERGAKTQILLNTACWAIDQGSQAGNIFWLMPTEHDARKAIGERIIPVFRARDDHGRPGRIARYISHAADDTSRSTIRFNHGIRLFPAWANSPGSMAAYFGRVNIADECDKFPERTSEGSDPITLFLKRARDDRHRSKYVFASTPAGRFIHRGTQNCSQVNTWAMRCPDCGELVTPGEDHLHIPEGTTPDNALHADLALACPACGTLWDEERRAIAYHGGAPLITKGKDNPRPDTVGWHIPAWVFPNIPLSEIAAAKIKADAGDLTAKVAWANGYKVEDYKQEVVERQEDAILALRDDRAEGELPQEPIAAITAVADMQKRGFWYKITAWGYGLQQESWLLRYGFVDSWEALRQIFFETEFTDHKGRRHAVTLRGLDSGGGESAESELSRTAEAYLFAYQNPGVKLFKGFQKLSSLHTVKALDKIPGTNRALPGGINLHRLHTTEFKNRLAAKLQVPPGDPGAWHLHRDTGNDFAAQMCAEVRDENGYWQNPKKRANHLWDCAYMELALVDIDLVKLRPKPKDAPQKPKPTQHQAAHAPRSRPSWFHNRGR